MNIFKIEEDALIYKEELLLRGQESILEKRLEDEVLWYWVYIPCTSSKESCEKLIQDNPIFFHEENFLIKKL